MDFSKVKVGDKVYDVKDETARTLINNLSTVASTGNYNDLTNKPTIPTKTSDLTNDSGYITKDVNDLTNYTKTSDLSSVATSGNYNDLSNKPTIPTKTSDLTNDSRYVTNTDYASSTTGGVIKLDQTYSTYLSSGNALRSTTKTYTEYNNGSQYTFISKGTLENVITGKGLVSNTDYATTSTGGVIKTNSAFGTAMSTGNSLISSNKSYSDYNDMSNNGFISKGTLENVITGKNLISNDMAIINASDKSISGNTAWYTYTFGFTSSDSFITSDPNLFEFDSNGIKCKFNGTVLILRAMTLDGGCNDKEFDLIDEYGSYNLLKGVNKNSFSAKTVSTNDVISLQYISEVTSFTAYRTRIIVVRLK